MSRVILSAELVKQLPDSPIKSRLLAEVAWAVGKAARFPHLQGVSLRQEGDPGSLEHGGPVVCVCRCGVCGEEFVVNKGDVHQVKACKGCRKTGDASKKVTSESLDAIRKLIAA